MDKKYAIFDMDGTLIDSMPLWQALSREYLERAGIYDVPEEVLEKIKPMTVAEYSAYFVKTFSLPKTEAEVAEEVMSVMRRHYREDIPLKEGADIYLRGLKEKGVRMCIASATAEPLIEACLKRLGVLDCFEFWISCERVGAGKRDPAIYLEAAGLLDARPEETAVYEDAVYAANTAKQAGFYVYGVYDSESAGEWETLCSLTDAQIEDWKGETV